MTGPAPPLAALAPGRVDQNPPHRLGRGSEEVSPTVPALGAFCVYQPQVGFVHQRRRLQRLTGLLLGQLLRCQLAQLVINEWQELFRGVRVALLDGGQDVSDIIHELHHVSMHW